MLGRFSSFFQGPDLTPSLSVRDCFSALQLQQGDFNCLLLLSLQLKQDSLLYCPFPEPKGGQLPHCCFFLEMKKGFSFLPFHPSSQMEQKGFHLCQPFPQTKVQTLLFHFLEMEQEGCLLRYYHFFEISHALFPYCFLQTERQDDSFLLFHPLGLFESDFDIFLQAVVDYLLYHLFPQTKWEVLLLFYFFLQIKQKDFYFLLCSSLFGIELEDAVFRLLNFYFEVLSFYWLIQQSNFR